MEYGGLLLDKEDAEYREKLYEGNEKFFMYFFEYDKKIFWYFLFFALLLRELVHFRCFFLSLPHSKVFCIICNHPMLLFDQLMFLFFLVFVLLFGSIDSTEPNDKYGYGRYINHSRRSPNIEPLKIPDSCGKPRIIFRASRNIFEGEELLFDYGDRENIKTFPWLDE